MSAAVSLTWTPWDEELEDEDADSSTPPPPPIGLRPTVLASVREGWVRKRIIAVDVESRRYIVVTESAYVMRDFRETALVPFEDAIFAF